MENSTIYDFIIICHTVEMAKVTQRRIDEAVPLVNVKCLSKRQVRKMDGLLYRNIVFHPAAGLTLEEQRELDLLSREVLYKTRRFDRSKE